MDQAGDVCAFSRTYSSAALSYIIPPHSSSYPHFFFLPLFQVASDCIWSDPASEVMERSLDETGFGDSPRGGGAVWYVTHCAHAMRQLQVTTDAAYHSTVTQICSI